MTNNYLPYSLVGWVIGIVIMLVILFAFFTVGHLFSDGDILSGGGKKRRQIRKKRR